jgi:hypothetical protein
LEQEARVSGKLSGEGAMGDKLGRISYTLSPAGRAWGLLNEPETRAPAIPHSFQFPHSLQFGIMASYFKYVFLMKRAVIFTS